MPATLAGKRRRENQACKAIFGYKMSSGKVWANLRPVSTLSHYKQI